VSSAPLKFRRRQRFVQEWIAMNYHNVDVHRDTASQCINYLIYRLTRTTPSDFYFAVGFRLVAVKMIHKMFWAMHNWAKVPISMAFNLSLAQFQQGRPTQACVDLLSMIVPNDSVVSLLTVLASIIETQTCIRSDPSLTLTEIQICLTLFLTTKFRIMAAIW